MSSWRINASKNIVEGIASELCHFDVLDFSKLVKNQEPKPSYIQICSEGH